MKIELSLIFLLTILKLSAQQESFHFDYFGQVPPDTTVKEFIIPDKIRNDYDFINSIAFSPSGNAIVCGLTDSVWSMSTIIYSYKEMGEWTPFDTLSFCKSGINTNPTFLNDSVIYFSSRWNTQLDKTVDFDIFKTSKINNKWCRAEKVLELSKDSCREFMGTFSSNGEVYLTRLEKLKQPDRNSSLNNEIYYGKIENDHFMNVKNIGSQINTSLNEFCAFIDPNGKYLLFGSNRIGGFGQVDTYLSRRTDDRNWTNPQNLGNKINTAEIDGDAVVTPDGKYLFFIRRQDWKCDIPNRIYWVSTKIFEAFQLE